MGETIVFNVCNKPFKPLGIPSGQVKSCEGLPELKPTNIFQHYVIIKHELPHKHMVFTSQADLTNLTPQSHHQDIQENKWAIETTHVSLSAK
jgi:hypothetical protein